MLSSISNYIPTFGFGLSSSTEKSLPVDQKLETADQLSRAVAKGDFSQIKSMIKNGANPSIKDSSGVSPIEHAILDGHSDKLSLLFSSKVTPLTQVKPVAPVVLEGILGNDELDVIKNTIKDLKADDLESGDIHQFIKNYENSFYAASSAQLCHLMAAFASKDVFNKFIELRPNHVEVADGLGNNLLHYAVFNKEHGSEIFYQLVQKGANLSQLNSNAQTPISSLSAWVQSHDPLKVDRRDVYIFLSDWLPTVIDLCGVVPGAEFLQLQKYLDLCAILFKFGFVLERQDWMLSKILLTLAYVPLMTIPALNVPLSAYRLYVFANKAFESLNNLYNFGSHRPIQASAIAGMRASNAAFEAKSFYENFEISKIAYKVYGKVFPYFRSFSDFKTSSNANCGEDALNRDEDEFFLYNEKSAQCVLNEFEKTYQEQLKSESDHSFYHNTAKPFVEDVARDCDYNKYRFGNWMICFDTHIRFYFEKFFGASGSERSAQDESYVSPPNLHQMDLKERLMTIEEPGKNIRAAQDIIGQSIREFCKKPRVMCSGKAKGPFHPDKNKGEEELYVKLMERYNLACEMMKGECK